MLILAANQTSSLSRGSSSLHSTEQTRDHSWGFSVFGHSCLSTGFQEGSRGQSRGRWRNHSRDRWEGGINGDGKTLWLHKGLTKCFYFYLHVFNTVCWFFRIFLTEFLWTERSWRTISLCLVPAKIARKNLHSAAGAPKARVHPLKWIWNVRNVESKCVL